MIFSFFCMDTVAMDIAVVPRYGEVKCQSTTKAGKDCSNMAYYAVGTKCYCGVHSNKDDPNRRELKKDTSLKAEQQKNRDQRSNDAQIENIKQGKRGELTVSKMPMIKQAIYLDGYVNVYPNFKHGGRKDGLGMPRLSPKSLGPVEHVMPNLPPARSIENYHQFAKFWSFELTDEGLPTREAMEQRIDAYKSDVPHRHKHDREILKKYGTGNVNIPAFSLYYTKSAEPRQYTYLECRYFYCYYYEKLTQEEPDFHKLKDMLSQGYNLNISGYDGYAPVDPMKMYLDTSRPFGHEMVLYCLLINKYPWKTYREQHPKLYQDMFEE